MSVLKIRIHRFGANDTRRFEHVVVTRNQILDPSLDVVARHGACDELAIEHWAAVAALFGHPMGPIANLMTVMDRFDVNLEEPLGVRQGAGLADTPDIVGRVSSLLAFQTATSPHG